MRRAMTERIAAARHTDPSTNLTERELQVLRGMDGMSSGFDRAELLMALAGHMPADAALIAQYRQAARGLSAHDRGRVEAAIDHLTPS